MSPSSARTVPQHPAPPRDPRRPTAAPGPSPRARVRGTIAALVAAFALLLVGPATSTTRAALVGPRLLTTVVADGPVRGGSPATFRVTVRNPGTATTTAPVTVRLSSGLTPVQANGPGWQCTAGDRTLACATDAELAPGATLPPLDATVTAPPRTSITGEAELVASTASPGAVDGGTASATIPVLDRSPADVVLSITAPTPTPAAVDRAYDVRVRNVSDVPTTEPVAVAFDPASGPVRASGLGWVCDQTTSRCVFPLPLLGDAEAPPLRALTAAGSGPSLAATVSGGGDRDPERSNDLASATAVLARGAALGADLAVTIPELAPVVLGERGTVPVRVQNVGNLPASGPVDVVLQPYTRASFVGGVGWVCTSPLTARGLRCTHEGPVPAGAALPDLRLDYDATITFGLAGLPLVATVAVPAGVDVDPANDRVSSTATLGSGAVELSPTFSSVTPALGGRRGTAELVVHNDGSRASSGRIVVRPSGWSGVTGGGWRCYGSCVFDDPVPSGGAAPPLGVRIGDDGDLRAEVSGGGDPDLADGRAATRVPGAPARSGRYLTVSGFLSAAGPGAAGSLSGLLTSGGAVPITGPVDLRVEPGPGVVVQDLAGPGLRCVGLRCRFDDGLPTGRDRSFGARVRIPARVGGPAAVRLRVSAPADRDVTPDDARVSYVPRGTGGDLVASVDDGDPIAPGATSELGLVVRNVGDAPVRGPVVATVPAPPFGTPGYATGDGWICEVGGSNCLHAGPVAPGGTLPPLVVRRPVSWSDDQGGFSSTVRALSDDDTGGDNGVAGGRTPVSGVDVANLTTAVAALEPAPFTGDLRFVGRVRNTGTRTTTVPVEVYFPTALGPPFASAVKASGPSWACPAGDDRCVLRRALGPGEQAPPLLLTGPTVRFPLPGLVETIAFSAQSPEGTSVDDTARAELPRPAPPGTTGPDATVTLTGGDPLADGDVTDLRATVRGVGGSDPSGGTVLQLSTSRGRASASGDGWECDAALRCATDADARAGVALPPVALRLRAPASDPAGASRVTAEVSVAGDTRKEDDRSVATVGSGEGRADLVVRSSTAVPPRAGATAVTRVRVVNVGTRGTAGPTAVTVSGGPAASISGTGWTCAAQRCTTDRVVPAGGEAPELRVSRTFATDDPLGRDVLTATVDGAEDDASGNDTSNLVTGVGVGTRAAPGRSLRLGVDALPEQASPGDVVPVQLAVRGGADEPGRSGTVSVVLPDDLAFVLPDPDEPAPTIAGRRLTWEVDVPADRAPATIRFSVVVAPTATAGPRALAATLSTAGTADATDESSLLVVPRDPPPSTGPPAAGATDAEGATSATAGSAPSAPTAESARLAALLAALAGGAPASTPGARPQAVRRPTVRLVPARTPRVRTLARSGWVVAVRTGAASVVRVDLVADATTARRLRVRRGTVLAAASAPTRRAGELRLRLRVPAGLRAEVRRAVRLGGTLRARATSPAGTATATRRVTVRR